MKNGCVCLVAGFAASGACRAQDRPSLQSLDFSGQYVSACRAIQITGLTVDGQYVYGDTIDYSKVYANRTGAGVIAYDAAQMADTDFDGLDLDPVCADAAPHSLSAPSSRYWFGQGFNVQSYAEDIVVAQDSIGIPLNEIAFAGIPSGCDSGTGTQLEPLFVIFESWEGFDNVPQLDGFDGFDVTPAGNGYLAFPASRVDNDGDTFIDGFLGGVVLDFNNVDTNNDMIPDLYNPGIGSGYRIFAAGSLNLFEIYLTSNLDQFDGGLPGTDGRGDGGIRLIWSRGTGDDGMGPLSGGYYPASKAQAMLWGTYDMQGGSGACPYGDGFGAGDSTGTLWTEGEDVCGDGMGCGSCGAPSGNEVVDDLYDTSWDINDFTGLFTDFDAIGPMIRLVVANEPWPGVDCCDINGDGACSPADFSAWVAAFNANSSQCDVNQDGNCTPADFSAWITAFNASTGGNPQNCIF